MAFAAENIYIYIGDFQSKITCAGMPIQLGGSRNVVYVETNYTTDCNISNNTQQQACVSDMIHNEGICKRICTLFKNELFESTIKVDGKQASKEMQESLKAFLEEAVFYYLAHGFVPFRLVKMGSIFAPIVIAEQNISWNFCEPCVEEYAASIEVEVLDNFLQHESQKKPRIYVCTFERGDPHGLLSSALSDYAQVLHSRSYQIDYMNQSRQNLLLWQKTEEKSCNDNFNKPNTGQILSVSDTFRMSLDQQASSQAITIVEAEQEDFKQQSANQAIHENPILKSCTTCLMPPSNTSGHFHSFRPPSVNHEPIQKTFENAVLDSCNIPRDWSGSHQCDAYSHTNKHGSSHLPQYQNSRNTSTFEALKTMTRHFEILLSYVITFIMDPSSKSKLVTSQSKHDDHEARIFKNKNKNKTINIMNLYFQPSHYVEINRVCPHNFPFLKDMFENFIADKDDFCSGVLESTGVKVSQRYLQLNDLRFKSQMAQLKQSMCEENIRQPINENENNALEKTGNKRKGEKPTEEMEKKKKE